MLYAKLRISKLTKWEPWHRNQRRYLRNTQTIWLHSLLNRNVINAKYPIRNTFPRNNHRFCLLDSIHVLCCVGHIELRTSTHAHSRTQNAVVVVYIEVFKCQSVRAVRARFCLPSRHTHTHRHSGREHYYMRCYCGPANKILTNYVVYFAI